MRGERGGGVATGQTVPRRYRRDLQGCAADHRVYESFLYVFRLSLARTIQLFHTLKVLLYIRAKAKIILTVRNEVAKVMFLQASVCPQGGWGCLPGADTPGSRHPPTPWEQTPPPGADTPQSRPPSGSRHPPEQTHPLPPEIRLLLRTVRILLECILLSLIFVAP